MAVTKQYLKSKPLCKVKFRLEADQAAGAENVFLVGDFNGWDLHAAPMKALKSGEYTATLDLETGRDYQFRYRIECSDGDRWENDSGADRYEYSTYGSCDNSVVVV